MRRRLVLAAALLVGIIVLLSAYVALGVARDLRAARAALTGAVQDADRIEESRAHLRSALDRLDSPAARVLRFVPLVRQNLGAIEAVADAAEPVVRRAVALKRALDAVERGGLIDGGRVRLGLLEDLRPALRGQAGALARLRDELDRQRTGWLVPPLWDEFDRALEGISGLADSSAAAADLVDLAPQMLGAEGERTYLVVLLNNAELRGAGGLPSGVGTLSVDDGRLHLGRFHYARELGGGEPYEKVPAPADFERRFGQYKADTDLWANTTFSPDVPDVALVASRLFEKDAGIATDGVLFADPRGVAALTPADATLTVPTSGTRIGRDQLARYVYWKAYEELGGANPLRRDVTVSLGEQAFRATIASGFAGVESFRDAAAALGGEHLRIVSFDPAEGRALRAAGVTGELLDANGDVAFVTVDNFGGDKLDYWVERAVEHNCEVVDRRYVCETIVTLRNRVRDGLPRYIAGLPYDFKRVEYGVSRSYAQVYLPKQADVLDVTLDGEEHGYFPDGEEGLSAVGAEMVIAQGEASRLEVLYEGPLDEDAYALDVAPQPLASDALLRVSLALPSGWTLTGSRPVPEEEGREGIVYDGRLDDTLSIDAYPDERTGISGLWARLARFWNEPVF